MKKLEGVPANRVRSFVSNYLYWPSRLVSERVLLKLSVSHSRLGGLGPELHL